MSFYIKKPIKIEAVQFNGSSTHCHDIKNWISGGVFPKEHAVQSRDIVTFEIETLEGNHTARMGDYIIKGVAGEFYPCKPDIFEKTYYTQKEFVEMNELE